ncbi:leucine-rich repeat domain-containing protein [Eubacterium xylanophilum]|uniref:leucine-rich repeat domain-containing protein n=1 Tax=Eubacterium xylanophilum TaxID=39497 RepID=UPI00047DC7D5|nr:leucine-rich repeat domain-containing protein [Eubacterium xylanophilum]
MHSKKLILLMLIILTLGMFLTTSNVDAKVKTGKWRNMRWSYNTKSKVLKVWGNGYMDYVGDLGDSAGWTRYLKAYNAEKLVISGNVKSVGEMCFEGFLKLEEVVLPPSIYEVSSEAFNNCQMLKKLKLPYGLRKIKKDAFAGTAIKKLVIPGTVKRLDSESLSCCKKLKELIINSGVKILGKEFLAGNDNLREIFLPKTLNKIAKEAFIGCGLEKLTIPLNVSKIGNGAFSGMDKLTVIKIKSTKVTKWGKNLFRSYEKQPKKITVVVPKSKYKEYKKIIKKNAGNKMVKVVKAKKF